MHNLNKLCIQELIFGYPTQRVKSVCPFFFYANPNMLGWIQPNLLKGRLSHKWGVVKIIYFFNLPAKFSIIRNYWVIQRLRTVLTFFSIIYCNKTTYYSNFDYPKNSNFRSDLSVPIKEIAIKSPLKIRSPNVTHGEHDFFVWSSLFLLYRLIIRKILVNAITIILHQCWRGLLSYTAWMLVTWFWMKRFKSEYRYINKQVLKY